MNLELIVSDWRTAWKMWSIRLAAAASAIIGYIINDPSVLFAVAGSLPEPLRIVFSALVGLLVFFLVAFTRLTKQKSLDPEAGESEGE